MCSAPCFLSAVKHHSVCSFGLFDPVGSKTLVCAFPRLRDSLTPSERDSCTPKDWWTAVNGCRQNEPKHLRKNITIIKYHITPVHQLMSCEAKSCLFVRNKCIIFLPPNCCFLSKYESIIHNNASSSEKAHRLLSSHIKIHQHICLVLLWTVYACKSAWSVHISFLIQKCLDELYLLLTQIFAWQ